VLHYACQDEESDGEIVKIVLAKGGDVEQLNKAGKKPFDYLAPDKRALMEAYYKEMHSKAMFAAVKSKDLEGTKAAFAKVKDANVRDEVSVVRRMLGFDCAGAESVSALGCCA